MVHSSKYDLLIKLLLIGDSGTWRGALHLFLPLLADPSKRLAALLYASP